ncbi:hypothetical protein IFO69_10495 [Echinicola sp. CAU 1574]|uniref:Uncharacterized protein n=1 Tax=Echinicola arenosa TaxID=2774144 RepID=A0ABR9AKU7_9BACT|nr:hypothetical protein [Echinicola arenosa]MBD8489174.1 hypothetical protein [Echinicola arenosa]
MARQSSFIKLEGTIGDVTFYKGRNGYNARQKGGITKERILKDEKFRRTRENLAEFARAASASKLLKRAFQEIVARAKDARTHTRVYRQTLKVLKSDLVSDRGKRKVEDGDISLFTGFQFSSASVFESLVFVDHTVQDNGTQFTVTFNPFVPVRYLAKPDGASHFKMFMVAASANFAEQTKQSAIVSSAEYPIDETEVSDLVLTVDKNQLTGADHFYALGIEFLQETNGKTYTLNNGAHNGAGIIFTEEGT